MLRYKVTTLILNIFILLQPNNLKQSWFKHIIFMERVKKIDARLGK